MNIGKALAAAILAWGGAGSALPAAAADRPLGLADPALEPGAIAADPGAAWDRFLAVADMSQAYAAYGALNKVGYRAGGVDAEECRANAPALRESVAHAPVGLAMRHAALLCAEALDDPDWADSEAAVFAALSSHALSAAGGTRVGRPVRVLAPRDPYAILHAGGLEFLYEFYQSPHPGKYFPLLVAAWDESRQKERHFRFDFIDATDAILRDDTYTGYPAQRHSLVSTFVKSHAEEGDIAAVDLLAVREAAALGSGPEKRAVLKRAADRGGIQSARAWLVLCTRTPFDGCGDGVVEALLPGAEARHGSALVLLAFAYGEGIGTEASIEDASRLLEAAASRWPPGGGAVVEYSETWGQAHGDAERPSWILRRLERAAAEGGTDARLHLVATRIEGGGLLDPETTGFLSRAEVNSLGEGFALLAANAMLSDKRFPALGWMNQAARAGNHLMMGLAAVTKLESAGDAAARAALLPEFEVAAHAGNADSARYLARVAAEQGRWKAAHDWLLAPAWQGDIDAILAYAELISEDHPGLPAQLDHAVEIYRALADGDDVPGARRALAALAFEGLGMPRDPAKARAWLLHDAERNDHLSQAMLGLSYLSDEYGEPDPAAAKRWLAPAIEAGDEVAIVDYGAWLYYSAGTSEARIQARDLWERGIAHDILIARNNFAWILCTSPDPAVLDPARGLEAALSMDEDHALDAGEMDTVAACHAATGDFESASRMQQAALEALDDRSVDRSNDGIRAGLDRMRDSLGERLSLYRSGDPYVEALPE